MLVHLVDEDLVQYADPETGEDGYLIRIENGMHPLAPGRMLGKCGTCDVWHTATSGPCTANGCAGTVIPYDGLSRMMDLGTEDGASVYAVVRDCSYQFLTSEEVPDPDTGALRKVLDATQEVQS